MTRAWLLGLGLTAFVVGVDACRTLEPREEDDGDASVSSSSSGQQASSSSSSSGDGASSSGGGSSSSGSSGASSSSSGEPPPPFDGGPILPPGDHSVGPNDRLGTLTVPTGYVGDPMPLVLLLHGTGESQASVETFLKFKPTADAKGFFVLRATGKQNFFLQSAWNADDACCSYVASPPDDSTYLADLVVQSAAVANVDPKRIYVVGHSSGGFMAYRLACDHADLFAGMVSIAGAADDTTTCTPAAKISVLQVHGDIDGSVGYGGGSFGIGYDYPGAVESVAIWAGYNGCAATAAAGAGRTVITTNDTAVTAHGTCPAGAAAELWTIDGAGHEPAYPATFSGQLADWLLARPKP